MPKRYKYLGPADKIRLIKTFILGNKSNSNLFHDKELKHKWELLRNSDNCGGGQTKLCEDKAIDLYDYIESLLERLVWIRDNAQVPEVTFSRIRAVLKITDYQLLDLLGLTFKDKNDQSLLEESMNWYLDYAINKSRTVLNSVSY